LASNSLDFNSLANGRGLGSAKLLSHRAPCQTGCPEFEHQPFVVDCPRFIDNHFGDCNPRAT